MNQITTGAWSRAIRHMVWSIPDAESEKRFYEAEHEHGTTEEWVAAHDEILLDMRAPDGAPDGIHAIRSTQGGLEGRSAGVVIREGHFIPENIAAACLEAVCKSYGITADDVRTGRDGIDHIYIERLEWRPEQGMLEVHCGS